MKIFLFAKTLHVCNLAANLLDSICINLLMKCFRFATTKSASTLHDRVGVCKVVYQICNKFASESSLMQIHCQ